MSNDYDQTYQPGELESTRPIPPRERVEETHPVHERRRRRRRRRLTGGMARFILLILVILAAYFFAPLRTNLLILGLDRVPEGTALGRSDTMILVSVQPFSGEVGMLSIPRDLWVAIPGYGENRINTAHYFAEGAEPGSGPQAAMQTVESNFGVNVSYYVRVRLEGFAEVVDALGGIDIELSEPTTFYPVGRHHLNGEEALAFVRDRTGDDFFRMQHAQVFVVSMAKKLLNPFSWFRLPAALLAASRALDGNLPAWQWPRLGLAILRAGPDGIDARSLDRSMVNPFVTSEGAQVLLPDWLAIQSLMREMFAAR